MDKYNSTEEYIQQLLTTISNNDKYKGCVFHGPGIYFVIGNGSLWEISDDASYSPRGGWFPDIVSGPTVEENKYLEEMMEKYDTVGIDMIAMVVNDILCVGAEPIALVDYLAVEEPDPKVAEEIADGLVQGAKESQIAIIGGETASLPGIVKDFDLAGTGIGFVDKDKIITGADIQEGDILIGLRSSGIHSNGLSLARRAIFEEGGFDVNDKMPNGETTIGEEMLKPTQLYVKAIVELLKHDFNIKGLAHMTGGGVNNLSRLKKGIGFNIDAYPEPQDIFKLIYFKTCFSSNQISKCIVIDFIAPEFTISVNCELIFFIKLIFI